MRYGLEACCRSHAGVVIYGRAEKQWHAFIHLSPLAFFVFSGCTCSCHLSGSLTHVALSWIEACCPGEHPSRSQSEASSEKAPSENMKIILLGSLFLKEVNTYSVEMHCIDKKARKTFILLQKISVSDQFCPSKHYIHQRIVKKMKCKIKKHSIYFKYNLFNNSLYVKKLEVSFC